MNTIDLDIGLGVLGVLDARMWQRLVHWVLSLAACAGFLSECFLYIGIMAVLNISGQAAADVGIE